jgi:hypothetical protein
MVKRLWPPSRKRLEVEILDVARQITHLEDELERFHSHYKQLLSVFETSSENPSRKPKAVKFRGGPIRVDSLTARVLKVLSESKDAVAVKIISSTVGAMSKNVRSALWYLKKKGLAQSTGRGMWIKVGKEADKKDGK